MLRITKPLISIPKTKLVCKISINTNSNLATYISNSLLEAFEVSDYKFINHMGYLLKILVMTGTSIIGRLLKLCVMPSIELAAYKEANSSMPFTS